MYVFGVYLCVKLLLFFELQYKKSLNFINPTGYLIESDDPSSNHCIRRITEQGKITDKIPHEEDDSAFIWPGSRYTGCACPAGRVEIYVVLERQVPPQRLQVMCLVQCPYKDLAPCLGIWQS